MILSIPIAVDVEDFIAWHPDPKGIFSVKSAYNLCLSLAAIETGQPETSYTAVNPANTLSAVWRKIWRVRLPRKLCVFMWRFTHNALPLKSNLLRRGIALDPICLMCSRLDEDGGHLFLKCKFARSVWTAAGMEHLRLQLMSKCSVQEVASGLMAQPDDSLKKAIVLLWNIWTACNNVNVGEHMCQVNDVVSRWQRQILDFQMALNHYSSPQTSSSLCWAAPPHDFLKVNIDGAFYQASGQGGWGFCCRDEAGRIWGAGKGHLNNLANALHAELIACLHALQFASRAAMSKIILETDALILKQALQSSDYDLVQLGVLFREAKNLILNCFQHFNIMHCNRACNKVAHALAKQGASLAPGSVFMWQSDVPDDVKSLAASDLAASVNQ